LIHGYEHYGVVAAMHASKYGKLAGHAEEHIDKRRDLYIKEITGSMESLVTDLLSIYGEEVVLCGKSVRDPEARFTYWTKQQ
jgi:hypothetical protein